LYVDLFRYRSTSHDPVSAAESEGRDSSTGPAFTPSSDCRRFADVQRHIIHEEVAYQRHIGRPLEVHLNLLAGVGAGGRCEIEALLDPAVCHTTVARLLGGGGGGAGAAAQTAVEVVEAGATRGFLRVAVVPVAKGDLGEVGRQRHGLVDLIVAVVVTAEVGTVGAGVRICRINDLIAAGREFRPGRMELL
jgi:hypothetical protein